MSLSSFLIVSEVLSFILGRLLSGSFLKVSFSLSVIFSGSSPRYFLLQEPYSACVVVKEQRHKDVPRPLTLERNARRLFRILSTSDAAKGREMNDCVT